MEDFYVYDTFAKKKKNKKKTISHLHYISGDWDMRKMAKS